MSTSYFVKRMIKQIKDSMDEQKFLTSESYRNFLEKTARGVSGNYSLKVRFGNEVCTDGNTIIINPFSPFIQGIKDLARKTLCILGQIAHETFHIIYTDFSVLEALKKMEEKIGTFRVQQLHEILNIIEDAAIELAGTNYYTGSFRQAIIAYNKNALEHMPSLEELANKNAPRLSIFLQACTMYCILGTLKGKIRDPELLFLFKRAMPVLDQGRLAPNTQERFKAARKVYEIAEPLIKEAEQQNLQESVWKNYRYTKNREISGSKGSQPQPFPPIQYDFQAKNREETKKEIERQVREQNNLLIERELKEKNELKSRDRNDSNSKEQDKKGTYGQDNANNSNNQNDQIGKSDEMQSSFQERGNVNKEGNKNNEDNKDNEDRRDNTGLNQEDEGNEEEVLKDLEKHLDKVKEEAAEEYYTEEQLKRRDEEIREFARSVKYSDLHEYIKVNPNTIFNVTERDRERYHKEYEEIAPLAKNLSKNLVDLIRFNEDVKLSGLYTGRIDRSKIYRLDRKIFYQYKAKSDETNLVILLLVDQSASMKGQRIKYARLACMMLYEVCTALKIPLAIIGHWAKYGTSLVYHNHFIDFDSPFSKYNISLLQAYENTREGVSLKYAGEYLLTRPEEDKILISISDGEPCHYSGYDIYAGEEAQKDTARVVKYLEAQGIKVFGVAIGEGKNGIKAIYLHNYIDIPSVRILPIRLVELIRRNLFK